MSAAIKKKTHPFLDALVDRGDIASYTYSEGCGVEKLIVVFPSSNVLELNTLCSGYLGETKFQIGTAFKD